MIQIKVIILFVSPANIITHHNIMIMLGRNKVIKCGTKMKTVSKNLVDIGLSLKRRTHAYYAL